MNQINNIYVMSVKEKNEQYKKNFQGLLIALVILIIAIVIAKVLINLVNV